MDKVEFNCVPSQFVHSDAINRIDQCNSWSATRFLQVWLETLAHGPLILMMNESIILHLKLSLHKTWVFLRMLRRLRALVPEGCWPVRRDTTGLQSPFWTTVLPCKVACTPHT
jgi:hypothetical protein